MKNLEDKLVSITLIAAGVLLLIMCCQQVLTPKEIVYIQPDPSEYQIMVTDDSISVYDGKRFVGTVKSSGAIDTLLIQDNL